MNPASLPFAVIFASPGFAVINKPPDVAMDPFGQPEGAQSVQGWATSDAGKSALETAGAFAKEKKKTEANDDDAGDNDDAQLSKKQQWPQKDPNAVDGTLRFVHQLDYATSGLLALTFSKRMAQRLAFCFESRQTRKEYLAVVYGWVNPGQFASSNDGGGLKLLAEDEDALEAALSMEEITRDLPLSGIKDKVLSEPIRGVVTFPIGHDPTDERKFRMRAVAPPPAAAETRERDADSSSAAKSAATIVTVLAHATLKAKTKNEEEDNDNNTKTKVSLVHLQLLTGRRHQLRVHCASLGAPIVGDTCYVSVSTNAAARESETRNPPPRMMLHAWRLSIPQSAIEVSACAREEKQKHMARRREIKHVRAAAAASTSAVTAGVVAENVPASPAAGSSTRAMASEDEPRISFVAPEGVSQFLQ